MPGIDAAEGGDEAERLLLALSGRELVRRTCPLMTQSRRYGFTLQRMFSARCRRNRFGEVIEAIEDVRRYPETITPALKQE